MIKFQTPYFRIQDPITLQIYSQLPIQKQSFNIIYLTDVVFEPKKYLIQNKIEKISEFNYNLTLNFQFAISECDKYNQMLNNIGLINITDLKRKMAMILSKQNDGIYLTLIAANNS